VTMQAHLYMYFCIYEADLQYFPVCKKYPWDIVCMCYHGGVFIKNWKFKTVFIASSPEEHYF
jgi:hypothetical protein